MTKQIFKIGLIYFGVVFGCGFLLGTIRTIFLVPQIGARAAELCEIPIMLTVIWVTAKWLVSRYDFLTLSTWLATGCIALVLMLAAEFGFVLRLQGLTLAEYFEQRDPLSGAAYYFSLLVFAVLPALKSWLRGKKFQATERTI